MEKIACKSQDSDYGDCQIKQLPSVDDSIGKGHSSVETTGQLPLLKLIGGVE